MTYQMTPLEEKVKNIYSQLGITIPSAINMYDIANYFDVWIHEYDGESRMVNRNGLYSVFLNRNLSNEERWQDFGHELGHVLKHVGNQHTLVLPFKELQEFQANNFMYQFCVPTFMLLDIKDNNSISIKDGVSFISSTFNVTHQFAKERIRLLNNCFHRHKSDEQHRKYMDSLYPKAAPYSNETMDIVNRALEMKRRKQYA